MTTVLLAAGDLSGDLHAADFIRAFHALRPGTRFAGLGGDEMEKAGLDVIVHQRALAVGGFFELIGSAGPIFSAWRRMNAALRQIEPDLVVLVDSGGFNLPFARRIRRHSRVPILYYIAPQIWAWRGRRIRKLVTRVDRLALIFPFEPALYARSGLRADFVGHPLVDRLREARPLRDRAAALRRLGLSPESNWITLLPGSRANEVRYQLPVQLQAARLLHERRPELGFLIALAATITPEEVWERAHRAALPRDMRVEVISGDSHGAIRAGDVVIAKPGTATLETALLGRPMVVIGKASALTAAIVRRAIHVPYLSMPNLIAGDVIVPEFLQEKARPEPIAAAVEELLDGPARTAQLERLAEMSRLLGKGGAAQRTAAIAEEMLGTTAS